MGYAVKELFLTLQGEGAQAGRAAVFVRFTGCNLWSGVESARQYATCKFCDTDFVGTDGLRGGRYTVGQLADAAVACWLEGGGAGPAANSPKNSNSSPMVVLTGGEPLLQVDAVLVKSLQGAGFFVALETNGTVELPCAFDWVTVSPKAGTALKVTGGDELKLVFPQPELLPDHPALRALQFDRWSLQPMDGSALARNTAWAVEWVKRDPRWRLSLQTHKMLGLP